MTEVPPQYSDERGTKSAGTVMRIRDAEDLRCAIRLQSKLLADAKAQKAKAMVTLDELIADREDRLEELLKLVSVPVTALPPDAS